MPAFATCVSCHGFVPDLRTACVHCGAAPPRSSVLRAIATALLGVTSTVTLMACYGVPPKDECGATSCPEPCDVDADCEIGSYCLDHGPVSAGECRPSAICTTDAQCATGQQCDKERTTCEPIPPPR